MTHRYLKAAHEFDEALTEDLVELETLKAAEKAAEPDKGNAVLRIAREKSPLDEVKAIIESTKTKSAEEDLREYRVRQKLAAMRTGSQELVKQFIDQTKE